VFGHAILEMLLAWPTAKTTLCEVIGKPIKASSIITETAILTLPIAP